MQNSQLYIPLSNIGEENSKSIEEDLDLEILKEITSHIDQHKKLSLATFPSLLKLKDINTLGPIKRILYHVNTSKKLTEKEKDDLIYSLFDIINDKLKLDFLSNIDKISLSDYDSTLKKIISQNKDEQNLAILTDLLTSNSISGYYSYYNIIQHVNSNDFFQKFTTVLNTSNIDPVKRKECFNATIAQCSTAERYILVSSFLQEQCLIPPDEISLYLSLILNKERKNDDFILFIAQALTKLPPNKISQLDRNNIMEMKEFYSLPSEKLKQLIKIVTDSSIPRNDQVRILLKISTSTYILDQKLSNKSKRRAIDLLLSKNKEDLQSSLTTLQNLDSDGYFIHRDTMFSFLSQYSIPDITSFVMNSKLNLVDQQKILLSLPQDLVLSNLQNSLSHNFYDSFKFHDSRQMSFDEVEFKEKNQFICDNKFKSLEDLIDFGKKVAARFNQVLLENSELKREFQDANTFLLNQEQKEEFIQNFLSKEQTIAPSYRGRSTSPRKNRDSSPKKTYGEGYESPYRDPRRSLSPAKMTSFTEAIKLPSSEGLIKLQSSEEINFTENSNQNFIKNTIKSLSLEFYHSINLFRRLKKDESIYSDLYENDKMIYSETFIDLEKLLKKLEPNNLTGEIICLTSTCRSYIKILRKNHQKLDYHHLSDNFFHSVMKILYQNIDTRIFAPLMSIIGKSDNISRLHAINLATQMVFNLRDHTVIPDMVCSIAISANFDEIGLIGKLFSKAKANQPDIIPAIIHSFGLNAKINKSFKNRVFSHMLSWCDGLEDKSYCLEQIEKYKAMNNVITEIDLNIKKDKATEQDIHKIYKQDRKAALLVFNQRLRDEDIPWQEQKSLFNSLVKKDRPLVLRKFLTERFFESFDFNEGRIEVKNLEKTPLEDHMQEKFPELMNKMIKIKFDLANRFNKLPEDDRLNRQKSHNDAGKSIGLLMSEKKLLARFCDFIMYIVNSCLHLFNASKVFSIDKANGQAKKTWTEEALIRNLISESTMKEKIVQERISEEPKKSWTQQHLTGKLFAKSLPKEKTL